MADKQIGKVTHYYDKIGVAVVDLSSGLKSGEKLKFVKNDGEFTQTAESIQVDLKTVDKAKKGDSIGLKVDQKAKPGTIVYLVT